MTEMEDFVWRGGGVCAVTTTNGGTAKVIALSYGERGESGELWKEEGQTIENVKKVRHGEAERAAKALGASFECLDLGDYPLNIDPARLTPRIVALPFDKASSRKVLTGHAPNRSS